MTDALKRIQIDASEAAEFYLVGLLGEFASSRIPDEPLSLKLVRDSGSPAQRVQELKQVGDTSLYVAGFFADSLGSKLVDADYYANLGETAYRELAGRLAGNSSIADIYHELAAKFPSFVGVLAEVRKQVDFAQGDVVALYEQWLVTRSEWIERRLAALGVLVQRDPDDTEYLQ
ncbi:MAG: hypothetical protein AAGC55_20505 [Myxococcota bacterium]